MTSDLELVAACADTYVSPPSIPVPPTETDARITRASDGAWIVAFRGSVSIEDWVRDFVCLPIMVRAHPQLGPVHAGFLDGAQSVVGPIAATVGSDLFYLTGHSLGGALALGVGGLLVAMGKPPIRVATFGAPRFGMSQFATMMAPLAVAQYRRGNDIVPLLPFDVPPDFAFVDTRDPLIQIGMAQTDFLRCHAIAGYQSDLAAYLKSRGAAAA